mmetsp:Transcript_91683/g.191647  ORF Transcript_91683/g.191647 Transcript_91683/m.191647 type:complete len:103 (+) Transcript_91683:289-597(+)
MKSFLDTLVKNLNQRLILEGAVRDDFERPQLEVRLNHGLAELSADQSLRIEDCVRGITGDLVLRSIAQQPLRVRPSDIGGGGSVALIVGDDLHLVVTKDPHA